MIPTARFFFLVFLCVTASVSSAYPAEKWDPHADLIFVRGQIVTVDQDFSIYEGIAIKDGRIVAVGTSDEVLAHRGESTQVIDLGGKVVIPGIQDSHIHFLELGHDVTYQAELTFAKNVEDILQAVRDLKARLKSKPGDWLVGERWDQYKYPKMVTRWELDQIAPENPVLLNRVYRGVAVNTAVFRLMGIDDEWPKTWPDWWEKDPEDFTFEDKIYREKKTLQIRESRYC